MLLELPLKVHLGGKGLQLNSYRQRTIPDAELYAPAQTMKWHGPVEGKRRAEAAHAQSARDERNASMRVSAEAGWAAHRGSVLFRTGRGSSLPPLGR